MPNSFAMYNLHLRHRLRYVIVMRDFCHVWSPQFCRLYRTALLSPRGRNFLRHIFGSVKEKTIMKKLMWATGFLGMLFFASTGCHREGLDNNMNDAYEQASKCPAPVTPDKSYNSKHYGTESDIKARTDSTANSKSYPDTNSRK